MKEGWTYKKLGEVCKIDYGTRVVRSRDAGSKYPVYGGGGATFKMDTYNREACMIVSRFAMSEQCTRFVKGKFFLNDSGLSVSTKEDKLSQVFLNWQIIALNNAIYKLGRGTAQKNLDTKAFGDLGIVYPPLSEQKRIVERLDSAFAKIDALKANAKKQLDDAKALFQKALEKAMEPKEGWEKKTLKEMCTVITDGTHHSPVNAANGMYKYITAKNIKSWGLDLSNITYVSEEVHKEIINRCNPQKGDILYIKDGATTGIAIVNPLDEEFSLLSSVALIRPQKGMLLSDYLCYALNSPSIYEQTRSQMDGAAITRVTLVKIKGFTIPLPPFFVQQRIVERLDELSEKVKKLEEIQEKTIKECDALKQAILREVFE